MPPWSPELTALEEELVQLYPDVASAEQIVDLALLARGSIAFDRKATITWHNIIRHALHQERLEDLMQAAVRADHYEDNQELRQAIAGVRSWLDRLKAVEPPRGVPAVGNSAPRAPAAPSAAGAVPRPAARAETGDAQEPFFGIYNWSHYLSQALLLLVLLAFGILFAFTFHLRFLKVADLLLGLVIVIHGLALWREERLTLANFAGEVVRTIGEIADFANCRSALDAGCGLGRTTIGLLRNYPELRVTAVDIWEDQEQILGNSESQLERNLKAAGVAGRVEIKRSDVRSLTFARGSFDRVLAIWVLHELTRADQKVALSAIARVAGLHGRIVVAEYVTCLRNFVVFGLINWHYYSLRHWLELCSQVGLVVERQELRRGIAYLVLRVPPGEPERQ